MTKVVNLRIARKRALRKQRESLADSNRLAHGRPAGERKRDDALHLQVDRKLDQHRLKPEDVS